ncbi:hypothetical protein CEP52_017605, partial [Fusarium oligoseptatum]
HGVDAAVSFAPSEIAYDDMPGMIRWGGLLMVVGVVDGPLTIEPLDIIFKRYVIKTACNGTVRTLEECISFSAEHSIKPFVEFIGLEDLPQAIEMMEAGKLRKRVCVKFLGQHSFHSARFCVKYFYSTVMDWLRWEEGDMRCSLVECDPDQVDPESSILSFGYPDFNYDKEHISSTS